MKTAKSALLSAVLLLTPFSLFAAQRSENVTFANDVTVNGTQVPAGRYRVKWDGTGNVTATISKGKQTLVSAPATVTPAKSTYNTAVDTKGNVVEGIQFSNATLHFNQAGAAAPTAGN